MSEIKKPVTLGEAIKAIATLKELFGEVYGDSDVECVLSDDELQQVYDAAGDYIDLP